MNIAKNTTNKSFVKMWRYLQKQNVENNIFMLNTNDPLLTDFSVNKYNSLDKDSSAFEIYRSRVINEARENIWFYFRELLCMEEIDKNGNITYTRFPLDPVSMMMIYLYEKNKSFVLIDNHPIYHTVLALLWNYHKSIYGTDYLISCDKEELDEVFNKVNQTLANMPIKILLGSSQAIDSKKNQHLLVLSEKSIHFTYNYQKSSRNILSAEEILEKTVDGIMNSFVTNIHSEAKHMPAVFSLNTEENSIAYSYLLGLLNRDCTVYLSGMKDHFIISQSMIFYKMLKNYTPIATNGIYDTKTLEKNYIIDWRELQE